MRPSAFALVLVSLVLGGPRYGTAQSSSSEPFKLGTFEHGGRVFLGIVLGDSRVADLAEANRAFEAQDASATKLSMPADMTELITRYDGDLGPRLRALASAVARAASTPSYVHALADVSTLPPVRPSMILNAGGNYQEHTQGIAQQRRREGEAADETPRAVTAPGIWERKPGDTRDNPYLFFKSPTIVVGPYDPIRMPVGRDRIDFECEFNVVIGKPASHVPIDKAADYIFGYTIQIDVSDRGGRGDRKMGGSDWLVGKNHDTFAPLGPFIVPKEFIADPLHLKQTFTLNGEVMQDSNTSRMTHNIYELINYGSNILTLHPGDLISGGSPAGTNIERAEPRWMRAGDTAVCTIEGLGTQKHSVVPPTSGASQ